MVYNKSGGERSSIGKIDARVDNKVVRVGVSRLRKAARLLLVGGEHGLMAQSQVIIPLSVQKHVRLASIITLIFKKLVSFYEHVPPLAEVLPFGFDPLADWGPFRRQVRSRTNRVTHASWSYAVPPAGRTQCRISGVPVELPRASVQP
jgi:hypothetical protein